MITAALPSESKSITAAESLLPVVQVAERLTGRRPSPSTIWRWVRKGVIGGVKLNATRYLGRWHCKPSDFQSFLERETAAVLESESGVAAESPSGPAQVDDELRGAGLL